MTDNNEEVYTIYDEIALVLLSLMKPDERVSFMQRPIDWEERIKLKLTDEWERYNLTTVIVHMLKHVQKPMRKWYYQNGRWVDGSTGQLLMKPWFADIRMDNQGRHIDDRGLVVPEESLDYEST